MKTKKRATRYFFLGLLNTAIGYGIYEVLALTIFRGELLWVATLVSGTIGIFTGYYMHSKYTWVGRKVGKEQVARFFIWNVISSVLVKPVLTKIFELPEFLYKFAFSIFEALHIPFSYEFVRSTGIFVLITAVIMIINFLVYDRFVFGKKKEKEGEEDKDEERSESQKKKKE